MTHERVLIVDNYDSFVHNLFQRIGVLTGSVPWVVRNDRLDAGEVRSFRPTHIVLSPGPGNPHNHGVTGLAMELLEEWQGRVPVLGVCLGHQTIGVSLGASVVRAQEAVHGKTSQIVHDSTGVFTGLPSPLRVMRYHSLVLAPDSLPDRLEITARTEDGVVMAIEDRTTAMIGLQFHPESIGTELGDVILANFLARSAA